MQPHSAILPIPINSYKRGEYQHHHHQASVASVLCMCEISSNGTTSHRCFHIPRQCLAICGLSANVSPSRVCPLAIASCAKCTASFPSVILQSSGPQ
mmetsp:Transcript_29120/g.38792  ORF Transcript_29120/g.38792 Transcript_29120/m.38792 type:complete len:97 (+) Transcript_29120:39-329(+)